MKSNHLQTRRRAQGKPTPRARAAKQIRFAKVAVANRAENYPRHTFFEKHWKLQLPRTEVAFLARCVETSEMQLPLRENCNLDCFQKRCDLAVLQLAWRPLSDAMPSPSHVRKEESKPTKFGFIQVRASAIATASPRRASARRTRSRLNSSRSSEGRKSSHKNPHVRTFPSGMFI